MNDHVSCHHILRASRRPCDLDYLMLLPLEITGKKKRYLRLLINQPLWITGFHQPSLRTAPLRWHFPVRRKKKGSQDGVTPLLSIISGGAPLTNHSLPNASRISTSAAAAYGAAAAVMIHQEASKNDQFDTLDFTDMTHEYFRASSCANNIFFFSVVISFIIFMKTRVRWFKTRPTTSISH